MSRLGPFRKSLEEAMRRAAAGQDKEALLLLEKALERAEGEGNISAFSLIAKNAGVICSNTGEPRRALLFLEKALQYSPLDASLYLALADIYRSLGDEGEARNLLNRSRDVAIASGDQAVLEILDRMDLNGEEIKS